MTAVRIKPSLNELKAQYGGAAVCILGTAIALLATDTLPISQRFTLVIAISALLAWGCAVAEEWKIGVAAVIALCIADATDLTRVTAAATHDLMLLLVAAYMISFAVSCTGLLSVLAARVLSTSMTFSSLAWRLAIIVGATAFLVPATSARAAMLLPIHQSLVAALPDVAMRRAIALLIPTVILLSAGGVLTGAAAHVVALEIIAASGGPHLGYWQWLVMALPVALLSCIAAVCLILGLIVGRDGGRRLLAPPDIQKRALNRSDRMVLAIMSATVLLWMSNGWHGMGLATVGLSSAAVILVFAHAQQPFSATAVARAIDWKILALLISTLLLAEALVASGTPDTMAAALLRAAPEVMLGDRLTTVGAIAAVAMLSHLLILSRSARAAILIPALALPLSKAGHDMATVSLVIVIASGFCQLAPYGAKPLMIYSRQLSPAEFGSDLVRLGVPLFAISWSIIVAFAYSVWPAFGFFSVLGGNESGSAAFNR